MAPLSTRACADFMGFTPEFVRRAIDEGKLEAETLASGRRRNYRIHFDAFVRFLQAIGWQRLPASVAEVTTVRRRRAGGHPALQMATASV